MKQIRFLLLLLLAMVMSATRAFAQAVGTQFKVGTVTYQITNKDLQHPENNTVAVYKIEGSGTVTVPNMVKNNTDQENYKVTSVIGWLNNQIGKDVTEIIFSEGLLEIPDGAFRRSESVKKVTLPASCTKFGSGFAGCGNLQEFVVASGNPALKAVDGVLFDTGMTTLLMFPAGKGAPDDLITTAHTDYHIPSGVTTIRPYAFMTADRIGTLHIPASVVNIPFATDSIAILTSADNFKVDPANTAFCDIDGVLCSKDKKTLYSYPARRRTQYDKVEYEVPETIETIGVSAFYVSNIKSIDFKNAKTISRSALAFSFHIESVHFGKNVEKIEDSALSGCKKLEHITVDQANSYYKAENDVLFTKDGKTLIYYPTMKTGHYDIPEGTVNIARQAFYEANINSVNIAKSVKNIGIDAFGYSKASTVTFAPGSELDKIDSRAFYYMPNVEQITLPASVRQINDNAFTYMNKLKTITVEANSNLAVLNGYVFAQNPELTTFTFEGGAPKLKTIPSGMFSNDPKLTSFEVPGSVTSILPRAFQNTPNLKTVTFATPSQLKSIGEAAFAQAGIESIELPATVTTIRKQAFDNCRALQTIKIPAATTSIETGAFNLCESLTNISVEEGNSVYSAMAGMLTDKDKKVLKVFPAGKADSKYTLVPYFEKVDEYAFYGSEKITNITFPKTVTSIGQRAIALCKNLKSFSFMGEENVPTLTKDIMYESGNVKDITVFVRKKWYENSANQATIDNYNNTFKEVHPSFVTQTGYDRGTEFFPTSMTDAGVISFYTPRTSVIIPAKVKEDTKDAARNKTWNGEYNVSSVLDFAYENESKVEDIVFLSDIGVIGLNAFKAGTQLKGIYFVGNTPALLSSTDYQRPESYPFKANQAIYVKESKVNEYKTKWEVDGNTLGITHKIPQETHQFGGTVCFPFDVKYPEGQGDNDITPYVPMDYTHVNDIHPFVRAHSVDNRYVPAYTGVLIRSINKASVSSYCQMDEAQAHDKSAFTTMGYNPEADSRMVGAPEDTIITNESGAQYYAFRKSTGKFVKLNNGANFPHFKAYFRLADNAAAPAKEFKIVFDDAMVTGIDGIIDNTAADKADEPYYNLNGMQVVRPGKGVYIRGGKKVIIK